MPVGFLNSSRPEGKQSCHLAILILKKIVCVTIFLGGVRFLNASKESGSIVQAPPSRIKKQCEHRQSHFNSIFIEAIDLKRE